jgi:hypothetical protein
MQHADTAAVSRSASTPAATPVVLAGNSRLTTSGQHCGEIPWQVGIRENSRLRMPIRRRPGISYRLDSSVRTARAAPMLARAAGKYSSTRSG